MEEDGVGRAGLGVAEAMAVISIACCCKLFLLSLSQMEEE